METLTLSAKINSYGKGKVLDGIRNGFKRIQEACSAYEKLLSESSWQFNTDSLPTFYFLVNYWGDID